MIDIQAGLGTITSPAALVSGSGAVTINGNGATVSGPGVPRGLVDSGGLTVNNLTVTGFGGTADTTSQPSCPRAAL